MQPKNQYTNPDQSQRDLPESDDEFNSLVRHYGEMRGPNLEYNH